MTMRTFALALFFVGCNKPNVSPVASSLDANVPRESVDATGPLPTPTPAPTQEAKFVARRHDAGAAITIAAVGDISDTSIGAQKRTSDLIYNKGFNAVLLLGDNQYLSGTTQDYETYFSPTWGRFKALLRPTPGNHEYFTPGATGYFAYFGMQAGDPSKGYYSYDLGNWHLIALNTNSSCRTVGCDAASAQVAWLKDDLAQSKKKCTIAYWHHPLFNSGAQHGSFKGATALWETLYAADADVVLNGHEHIYERFDPQTPTGELNAQRGIREFIVGTGGIGFYELGASKPNSVVRQASAYGVLKLTLNADSYDWEFLAVTPSTFTDKGSGTCH